MTTLNRAYADGMSMVIKLPDEAAQKVTAAAAARGVSVETVVVELVMDLDVTDNNSDDGLPPLSFIGLGAGRTDLAEHHHEILAEHLRDVS